MKKITEITLYELMAEDLDVWVTRDKRFGFVMEIDSEGGEPMVREEEIHPFATDALAGFCRSYLASYDKASDPEYTGAD